MQNPKQRLAECRQQIDAIDSQMIQLLSQRMAVSDQVGAIKASSNLALTDVAREQQIIEAAVASVPEIDRQSTAAFMRTLISLSKLRQQMTHLPHILSFPQSAVLPQPASVVFQGVEGAWGQQATLKLFPEASVTSAEEFEDVFELVSSGKASAGVIPIENSQTGAIGEVYDLLRSHGCFIIGQTWLPINQCLLAKRGATLQSIGEVLSHPQSFGQCRRFLRKTSYLKTATANTAVAAKMVAQSADSRVSAIASPLAAEIYGLDIIATDIADNNTNKTRFIAIASQPIYDQSSDIVSITFSTQNQSGALCAVLDTLMLAGINLSRIESRPISADTYRFFVDFEGNITDQRVRDVLGQASVMCRFFEVLGCYSNKL